MVGVVGYGRDIQTVVIVECLVLVNRHTVARVIELRHTERCPQPLERECGVVGIVRIAAKVRRSGYAARRGVVDVRISPYDLAVPRIVDRETVVVAVFHDLRLLPVILIPELHLSRELVELLALSLGGLDSYFRCVESLLPLLLVVGLGEVGLARRILEIAVELAVAVEEGAGAIEQYLGLQGLCDNTVDLAEENLASRVVEILLLVAVLVIEDVVDKAQNVLEALLNGLALLTDQVYVVIGLVVLVGDDDRAVETKQVEVVVRLEHLHLRHPVYTLLLLHVGYVAQTVEEDVAYTDTLIEVLRTASARPESQNGIRRVVPVTHKLRAASVRTHARKARIQTADPLVAGKRHRLVNTLDIGHV